MKVREMGTEVRKLYSEGKISESGAKPSAVGGTIAMLNKEQCEEILRTGAISWDDLKSAVEKREGYMHQKRVGADNGSGDSEPTKDAGGIKADVSQQTQQDANATIEEKMEQINQNQQELSNMEK